MKTIPTLPQFVGSKKNLLAVLCFGLLGLGPLSTARAQITFTVDVFTANQLTITFNQSSLTNAAPLFADYQLMLVDNDNPANTGWVNANFGGTGTPGTNIGGQGLVNTGLQTFNAPDGDYVIPVATLGDFVAGTSLNQAYQVTFTSSAGYTPSAVSNLGLYWGDRYSTASNYVFQSSQSVASAVPEPSTYAALLGVAALGLAGYRRRQGRTSVAV